MAGHVPDLFRIHPVDDFPVSADVRKHHGYMLALASKRLTPLVATLLKQGSALVAVFTARHVPVKAMAALNRRRQHGTAMAAHRRIFIHGTAALGADHKMAGLSWNNECLSRSQSKIPDA
jgi:hypothetical protein